MKKILLVCLALLLMQGVCWGEGPHKDEVQLSEAHQKAIHAVMEKTKDKTIRITEDTVTKVGYTYVTCKNNSKLLDPAGYWSVDTDFTITDYPDKSRLDLTMDISYTSDDIYYLEPTAVAQLGDKSITLKRMGKSSYGNGCASAQYELTDPFFQSLIKHKGDIIIRLYYRDLTGQYYQDIKIKEKKVEDIKVLFSLIYPELLAAQ